MTDIHSGSVFLVFSEVGFQDFHGLFAEDAGGDLGMPGGIVENHLAAVAAMGVSENGQEVVVSGGIDKASELVPDHIAAAHEAGFGTRVQSVFTQIYYSGLGIESAYKTGFTVECRVIP